MEAKTGNVVLVVLVVDVDVELDVVDATVLVVVSGATTLEVPESREVGAGSPPLVQAATTNTDASAADRIRSG